MRALKKKKEKDQRKEGNAEQRVGVRDAALFSKGLSFG